MFGIRIAFMSDLHLEFETAPARAHNRYVPVLREGGPTRIEADLVVLAGDAHDKARGPVWASRAFDPPVVMVGGNHESYGDSLYASIKKNRDAALAQGTRADGTPRVAFLERESIVYTTPSGRRVRVLGATLWAGFTLFGADRCEELKAAARSRSNDYARIRLLDRRYGYGEIRRFDPDDAERLHQITVRWLDEELARPFDGPTVVVTHHAPSPRSLPEAERNDPLAAAYATDLEGLIARHRPALWIHGHIHDAQDYRIHDTRVVCNPRGYFPHDFNPAFEWGKTVEI